MLLEGKNAVVYGAGGSVGGAVARTFAREGARVFLTGWCSPSAAPARRTANLNRSSVASGCSSDSASE